jgi:predicted ABC-type ATPase
VIAGPNGAGKTTFALRYLLRTDGVVRFINADLIASGLAPLAPRVAAAAAGRLMLIEMRRLAAARVDFAFESTLSGLGYVKLLEQWQMSGYRIEIAYLRLPSPRMALRRTRLRVRQGGHDVSQVDVARRFTRGWQNFEHIYRAIADSWTVYDNSGPAPKLLEWG